ncbi:Smt3-specific protease [Pichia californica]|uniref:Smt3-specific protease n=1 Tax=Pichia californica TaxID=460514 RepID=A0A9P6WKY1_9ASCO|nr:Smt3-specific protease [[Candida] californica]
MSDSSEQSITVDRMTYNTLPNFANSKRKPNIRANYLASPSGDTSYNMTPSSNIAHKVEYPFQSFKHCPIDSSMYQTSKRPFTKIDGQPPIFNSRQISTDSLFGTRVWSSNHDKPRVTSENIYYKSKNVDHKVEEDKRFDSYYELVTIFINLGSLFYVLFYKFGLWMMWVLKNVSIKLLDKVRTIPIPEIDIQNQDMDAESTPRPNTSIFNPDTRNNYETEQGKEKNPFFHKKLQSVKSRLEKEKDSMLKETVNKAVESDESLEEIIFKKDSPKEQYGTHFFNSNNNSKKRANLETQYLKTVMNPYSRHGDKKRYDPPKITSDINQNLISLYSSSNEYPKSQDTSLIKPSFTRSTNRFQDLEWLQDDKADYLNNLEATQLYKEYQKIVAERRANQQLHHLSSMKERGLGVRPLKEEQAEEINKIWMYQPEGVLNNNFGIKITSADLLTLSDRHWLNDNVIDFYMQLIKGYVNAKGISKVHVFSTFFYTTLQSKGYAGVRKWAKRAKVDVSELDYVFVPCNLNQVHWALAVIDNVNQSFDYIDSLNGDGTNILAMLVEYMTEETLKNHGASMNGKDYSKYFINGHAECPGQQNGFDCGVFTCTAVDYLARNRDLDYSQADMSNLRRRMAWEILKGKLLDH